jgi:branched-chain amino acid transport system substrate-binding protein
VAYTARVDRCAGSSARPNGQVELGVSPVGPQLAAFYTHHVLRRRVVVIRHKWVLMTVCGVVVAACSGGGGALSTTTSSSSSTTSTTLRRADADHQLIIGTVLPSGGSVPDLGESLAAGVQLAVDQINTAGGVFGNPVRIEPRPEGDTSASALVGVQSLLTAVAGKPVDAIVGPASSPNVLATLAASTRAGVPMCSPTASALSLDQFPDNGLFFRTVPSDSLQAAALAQAVRASGTTSVGVVYLDDAYGRPFAREVERDMRARRLSVQPTVAISGSDASIAAAVRSITAARPPVVVVIADSVSGPAAINALDAAASTRVQYFVNDAMRHPDASVPPFGASLGKNVHGLSPLAYPKDASFLDQLHTVDPAAAGLFAVKAYDCVNLIALAAEATVTSPGTTIASWISSISSDGSECSDFASCKSVLRAGFDPDYNGPDEHFSVDDNGNPSVAMFEPFSFDANGRDVGGEPIQFP